MFHQQTQHTRPHTSPHRRHRAFTLLELLLAVTIIAIFSAVLAFDLFGDVDRASLDAASTRLLQTLRYARLLAAQHHQLTVLEIDLDHNEYWLTTRTSYSRAIDPSLTRTGDAGAGSAAIDDNPSTRIVVNDRLTHPTRLPEPLNIARVRLASSSPIAQGSARLHFYPDGSADLAAIELTANQRRLTLLVDPWTARTSLRHANIEDLPADFPLARSQPYLNGSEYLP